MQEDFFNKKPIYILDSSVIISLRQHYPKSIFESLHKKLSEILKSGKVILLDLVFNEIKDKEPELYAFLRSDVPKDRQLPYGEYVDTTQKLLLKYYDGHGGSHELKADPHIIGCAKIENLIVVTDEMNNGPTSIPRICYSESVRCIDFIGFLKEEKIVLI
jgi:hypothetical protein